METYHFISFFYFLFLFSYKRVLTGLILHGVGGGGIMLLPEAMGCHRKSPVPGELHLHSSCWSRVPGDSISIQAIAIVLGCQLKLDSRTLLLKIPHTSVTGHGEIKMALIRKLPYCWLAFIFQKVSMEAAVRE